MSKKPPSPFLQPRPEIRHVEQRAAETLEQCRSALGLQELPLPIPVEEWIERPLGIRFGITDLSHLGEHVLGAAFVRDREIQVSERAMAHEGRYRFTCAHELGHIVLHSKVRRVFQESGYADEPTNDRYERQANRFAAAFLLPVPRLMRTLVEVSDAYSLDRERCIAELMRETVEAEWLWRKFFLPEITQRFAVSLTAAVNRFTDVRLFDRKTFIAPAFAAKLLSPSEQSPAYRSLVIIDGFPGRPLAP